MSRTSRIVAFLPLLLVAMNLSAAADWLPDGASVCEQPGLQDQPRIIPDGVGGAIVAWADDRTGYGYALYAQRLDSSGDAHWTADGVQIGDVSGNPDLTLGGLVPDGSEGALIAWFPRGESEIYVFRVTADGSQPWGPPGVMIDTDDYVMEVAVASDGAGGMLLVWQTDLAGQYGVMAQRVDAAGNEVWAPGGIAVMNVSTPPYQPFPRVIPDGSGGAFVSAVRNSFYYAQRIHASGTLWSAGGTMLGQASGGGPQKRTTIAADDAGGIFVAWDIDTSGGDIYVMRTDGIGSNVWAGPVVAGTAPGTKSRPTVLGDGAGNAVVAWVDDRDGDDNVYAQKLGPTGIRYWPEAGVPVTTDPGTQALPHLLEGPGAHILVAYHDDNHVEAQLLDVAGGRVWGAEGVQTLPGQPQVGFDAVSDGMGGFLTALVDDRTTGTYDIFAGAVNELGRIYAGPSVVAVDDIPDDQGGWVRITFARSDRDDTAIVEKPIARYDVWRQIPAPEAPAVKAGATTRLRDAATGRPVDLAEKALIPAGFWERVGSFAATQDLEYFFRAPTLADSTKGDLNRDTYFVSAHTTDPLVWFTSPPDSGYSVDNIPPGVPTHISADYAFDGVDLQWDPAPEPDFQFWRIYRGTEPGFDPQPGDLVHELAENRWWDPTTSPWGNFYKIAAVDQAGNQGEAGAPEAVSGTPTPDVPHRTALGRPAPNPFNPATTFAFTLGEPGRVRLRVFDATGRRVAVLLDEYRSAGPHAAAWDGRDAAGRRVASGVYFCRLETGAHRETRSMVLVK